MRKIGNLSLRHAIGTHILCVHTPDPMAWMRYAQMLTFLALPLAGNRYVLTTHVGPCVLTAKLRPYPCGIRVAEIDSQGKIIPLRNEPVYAQGMPLGEPFFPYECFSVVSRP